MDKFKNLGEWAQKLIRAATGAGETDPTSGGFLVPERYSDEIVSSIYADRNSVLSHVRHFNIPDGSNSLNVAGVDEKSRADGYRWGGVVADFEDEGAQQDYSFPRLQGIKFSGHKIVGLVPVSNELVADAANLGQFLMAAFADELRFVLEKNVLLGTGAGKPLGVVNAPALVTVAAGVGQLAGTITGDNLDGMWWTLPSASRKRAIWAVGESAMKQLDNATGGKVYPQSGSTFPDDVPRIKGRPVIETDALPIVGALGDILLFDPAWYGIASKPMQSAMSAHVLFTGDQTVFRVTWRVDGRPLAGGKITASDGSTRSAYVALAARS